MCTADKGGAEAEVGYDFRSGECFRNHCSLCCAVTTRGLRSVPSSLFFFFLVLFLETGNFPARTPWSPASPCK